jgi:hypothetical protein
MLPFGATEDVGRPVESIGTVAGDARLAERHQHSPCRTNLEDLLPLAVLRLAVGHPDVVVDVHEEAMRIYEHAGAEACDESAGGIELQQRRQVRAVARAAPHRSNTQTDLPSRSMSIAVDLADLRPPGSCPKFSIL